WSYYLRKHKEESLKLDLKLNWKEKRFKNTPASGYDQVKIAPTLRFKKKDLYAVNLSAGLDNFNYLDADQKDQFKIFSKIGGQRYFLGKKLKLTSSAKIEQLEQEKINRERTKHNLMSGFNYIFDLPWLYKITARANWGERDTKEEEERDQDSDYEYQRYYTKTEHKINPGLKTNLKYQFFKKDYAAIDLDHRGFYIRNNWDYEILNDQAQRAWLDFKVEHKDVSYALKSNNDYQKETFKIKANYKRRKDWKVSASLQESFYNFNDSSKDKNRYYTTLSGEKLFLDGDLVMSIDFKHRYTENKQDNDTNEESVRVSFKYNF
ncbi:MAG: hypothetical protein KAV18_02145, partial [Candidatus Omnitrophica bacterium]|nr:hypothetical protein [Candidatus Omnitrophota bacterium]